jgi:pyruvate,water dikinase
MREHIIWFEKLGITDVERVGGKNASLGEMIQHLSKAGIQVPRGFATTAEAYRVFLEQSGLNTKIQNALAKLNVDDIAALTQTGAQIRQWIIDTPLLPE